LQERGEYSERKKAEGFEDTMKIRGIDSDSRMCKLARIGKKEGL